MGFLDVFRDEPEKEEKPSVAVLTRSKWKREVKRQLHDVDVIATADNESFIKAAGKVPLAMIVRPDSDAPDPHELETLIRGVKEHDTCLAVFDYSWIAPRAMKCGADYFVMTDKQEYLGRQIPFHTVNYRLMRRILDRVLFDSSDKEDEDALIIEKQEFYDYVGEEELYNDRSQQTANKEKEIQFLKTALTSHDAETVLDAGCGDGRLTVPLARKGFNMTGVDLSDELITAAKEKADEEDSDTKSRITLSQGNLLDTRFDNESFDAIILMWHVICDLRTRQEDLLKELYRVLQRDGVLIFDFPDRASHVDVNRDGHYENPVNNFMKYVGLVPGIRDILDLLETLGFHEIQYQRVTWGVDKFVVLARKA